MQSIPSFAVSTTTAEDAISTTGLRDGLSYWCLIDGQPQIILSVWGEKRYWIILKLKEPLNSVIEVDNPNFSLPSDTDIDNMLYGVMGWVQAKNLDHTQVTVSNLMRDIEI